MGLRTFGFEGFSCVPLHMHTWAPVPPAHAHLGAGAPCACTPRSQCPMYEHALQLHATVLHDIAEASGCKQPQAFGHMHRRTFPYMYWACHFVQEQHMAQKEGGCMPNACGRMIAVACSHMPRHRLPFLSNIGPHNSADHAMHATAKHARAWGIGGEVCMRTRQWPPIVHVHGAMAPKCA